MTTIQGASRYGGSLGASAVLVFAKVADVLPLPEWPNERPSASDMSERIEVWTNEGGAGGDVTRRSAEDRTPGRRR